jgi:hypothetical protein
LDARNRRNNTGIGIVKGKTTPFPRIAMKNYEYHRIGELAKQLAEAKVEPRIIDQIMEGGKDILRKTSPEKKADWMREAMLRMNKLLPLTTRKAVREGCACCLGGRRLKTSKAIASENATLEDRIKAANAANYVGSVALQTNGEIIVRFDLQKEPPYRCYCLPQAKKLLPITYCFCCGGHVKHLLQIALSRELDCATKSSALSSSGKLPCTFSFKIREGKPA